MLILGHYPILMWKNQHRGAIHLYGHLHNTEEQAFFHECLLRLNVMDLSGRRPGEKEIRAYNVGCMMPYMDYEPRTLEEIVGAEWMEKGKKWEMVYGTV